MNDCLPLYLDYHASTPVDPRVGALVAQVSDSDFANPHADDHAKGWEAGNIIHQAREQVATVIGALPTEVIFTSGATEADNLGVLGAALGAPVDRRRILVSAIEHKAVLESAYAAEQFGFKVEIIPVSRDGVVDLNWLSAAAGSDVAVISVMTVNNEIGTFQPIESVAEIGGLVGAFVHSDATQAPAARPIDVFDWNVDAASFSSHKAYGPKGVGALYVSSTAPWRPKPLMYGGGQEQGLRPGTLPTPLCAGFGLAMTLFTADERERVAALRDRMAIRLKAQIPNLRVTAERAARHPGNLHVQLLGCDVKELLSRIQPQMSASAGSACASGHLRESHVLQAIGLTEAEARSGLRLSIGRFTTEAEIDAAVETLVGSVRMTTA